MRFEIFLERLKVSAIVGILPIERTKAQNLEVDLGLSYEIATNNLDSLESVCDSDLCKSIIDYTILREIILDTFKYNEFFYLESALVVIQNAILSRFSNIITLNLSIKKLEIFNDCTPKVCLEWKNK